MLRIAPKGRVSKQVAAPFFETGAFRALLRMRRLEC